MSGTTEWFIKSNQNKVQILQMREIPNFFLSKDGFRMSSMQNDQVSQSLYGIAGQRVRPWIVQKLRWNTFRKR